MRGPAGGADNRFTLMDPGSYFTDTTGRTPATPSNPLTLVFPGQSHWGNHNGAGPYTVLNPTHVFNLNIHNGTIYRAAEPLLGCSGSLYGSPIARLGDKLYAARGRDILLVPCARGGTTVGQWTPQGEPSPVSTGAAGAWLNHRLLCAIWRCRQQGFEPDAILWNQGGQDAAGSTSQADWQARFMDVYNSVRGIGCVAPWLVAVETTLTGGITNSTIQAAEAAVVNGVTIFDGANTDTLTGATYRQSSGNDPHFTDTGDDVSADRWKTKLDLVI